MIKLNLNKTRSTVASDTELKQSKTSGSALLTDFQTAMSSKFSQAGPGFLIKMLINIIFIACFPLGLKIYEVNQINKLKTQLQKEKNILEQNEQQLSALKTELDSYGYLKEKTKEFETKKEFLSQLTEKRLDVPRILDFIEDKRPDTVWLKKVQIDISREDIKKVSISGESFKERSVNAFASSLEQILNGNTITVNMRDIKEGSSVIKISFDLKGEI